MYDVLKEEDNTSGESDRFEINLSDTFSFANETYLINTQPLVQHQVSTINR